MSELPLTVVLKADGSGLTGTVRVSERELKRLKASLDESGRSAEQAGRKSAEAGEGMRRGGRGAEEFAEKSDRATRSGDHFSQSLKRIAASVGFGLVVRATVREIAGFEQSMSRVQAVSRANVDQMARMSATARELGASTRFSASEAAEGMAFLAMAGFNADQVIAAMPATLNLATAAQLDLGRAADITSNIMSAFGLKAEETGRIADALASIAASANTDISQMGEAMKMVGPPARAMGIEMEDAAAAIGVLSNQGLQGSTAGTGLRRVLSSLIKPTKDAQNALEGMGVKLEEVNPATNSLIDVVKRLAEANIEAEDAFRIFGDRGAGAILALTSNIPDLERLTGTVRDSTGEAERMSKVMNDNLSGDFAQLKSAIAELMLQTGDGGLLGILRSLTQEMTEFVRLLSGNVAKEGTIAGFIYEMVILKGREMLGAYADNIAYIKSQIEDLEAAQRRLNASMKHNESANWFTKLRGRDFAAELEVVNKELEKWRAELREAEGGWRFTRDAILGTSEALSGVPEPAAAATNALGEVGGDTATLDKATTDFIAKLEQQLATMGLNESQMLEYAASQAIAADETGTAAAQIRDLVLAIGAKQAALDADAKATEMSAAAQRALTDAIKAGHAASQQLATLANRQAAALGGPGVRAAQQYRNTLVDIHKWEQALLTLGPMTAADVAMIGKARADAAELYKQATDGSIESARELESILSQFDDIGMSGLVRDINLVRDALEEATDPKQIARMEAALVQMNAQLRIGTLGSYQQILGAMQAFTKEGSKGFKAMEAGMAALSIVQDLIAMKAAVSAVLTQGQGDPYSAWARMIAMAAAVAPMIASIGLTLSNFGGSGGGFTDTAAIRQQQQGTGTVLGDAAAKSESIANATQITADATSALVGINRGMLRALNAMQAALSSAGGMLARGAGNVEFSRLVVDEFRHAFLPSVFTPMLRLLSGRSQVTDQGIRIGGSLSDIGAQAYQEEQYRSWRFGRTRTRDQTADLPDDVASQFQLIMDSIVNTVREGALALGLLPDEIERALETYRIAEQSISLMDLNAEEKEAALAAVFGSIFDGLAGHVVPFIAQFQRVGEGLGETLVRVATGVQVTQEAVRQLGFALDETDPERFAQISEGLIEMAGGLEAFISGMAAFVDAFAPDEHKFQVAEDALNRAFAQFNLVVPATREEMWALMQSLDATTEQGREQIAMLLQLAPVADAYYRSLEQQGRELERQAQAMAEYTAQVQALRDELDAPILSAFRAEWRDIGRWADETAESLHAAARAAGMQAAAEQDLGLVHQVAAQRAAAAIRRLQDAARGLVERLYGTALQQIDAQIEALGGSTQTQLDGIAAVDSAAAGMYQRQLAAIQNIKQWLDNQLLDPTLSSLTPQQRLDESRSQLEALAAAARAGDIDALEQLPQAATAYLRELRDYFASSEGFTEGEAWVRELMQGFANMNPGAAPGVGGGGGDLGVSPELQALYEEREQLLAQIEAETRRAMAEDIATMMRDLIAATGDTLETVAASIRVSLADLVADLGVNLEEMTVTTAVQLAEIARMMGVNLSELTAQLGVDLGTLGDRQSLLNQALDETLLGMPDEFRERLLGPLEALRSAVTDADVNDAMFDLLSITDDLPAGIRDLLAPFFDAINPSDVITELGTLRGIEDVVSQQLAVLDASESRLGVIEGLGVEQLAKMGAIDAHTHQSLFVLETILENLRAQNREANIPQYEAGTGYVPATGTALLHQGEMVLPAPVAAFFRREGIPSAPGTRGGGELAELRAIRETLDRRLASLEQRVLQVEHAERETGDKFERAARRGHDTLMARRG